MIEKLTNSKIKLIIKNIEKDTIINDGDGLYLKISKIGSCYWYYRYTSKINKKRRNLGIGSYPAISIKLARLLKNKAKLTNVLGKDPIDARVNDKIKVDKLFNQWCELKLKSSKSFNKIQPLIKRYLIDEIKNFKIEDLQPQNIIVILQRISRDKGIYATLNKITMYFNQFIDYCVNYGYLESNRFSKISKCLIHNDVNHLPTVPVNDLHILFNNLANKNILKVTLYLLLFNILTFVRPNEASNAEWSEIDFKNKVWIIPSSKMKMKKEHRVPLSEQLILLLTNLKKITGQNKYLFPQKKDPTKPMNKQTINSLLKRNGFKSKLVSHGFREMAIKLFKHIIEQII